MNGGGVLLFPDNRTITGKSLLGTDGTTVTSGFSVNDLDNYILQGCRFLAASGYYVNARPSYWTEDAYFTLTNIWTSSITGKYNYNLQVFIKHNGGTLTQINTSDTSPYSDAYMPIILVQTAS